MPMTFRGPALSLALAFGLFAAGQAFGQAIEPGKEGELANFVPPQAGARACFGRVYDAAHLKDHPKQQVTEMQFRIAYYIHDPDEFAPKDQRNYYFQILAKLRDAQQGKPLTAMGECRATEDGKSIFCGVDCDGGGVIVKRNDAGKVLVDLEAMGRLRMTLDCGEDETDAFELTPGADDKRFLLTKLPQAGCPAYDDW